MNCNPDITLALRTWNDPQVLMRASLSLLDSSLQGSEQDLRTLDSLELSCVPVENPDGYRFPRPWYFKA